MYLAQNSELPRNLSFVSFTKNWVLLAAEKVSPTDRLNSITPIESYKMQVVVVVVCR